VAEQAAAAAPGIQMSKAPQPVAPATVPVHAYDRGIRDFTTIPREPSPQLLGELRDNESLYSRLIDCLGK
jgi:hypothetical protein